MDRRQFLKWGSFMTVTIATGGLAACGGGGGDDDEPDTGNPENFNFVHGVASGDPKQTA
ncbi:hypothetical protein CTP10_R37700 [Cupriavidus sp. P-10]|nr:hypothetical protein CTP10_R37700 [Cupriavidus sp. P-10]